MSKHYELLEDLYKKLQDKDTREKFFTALDQYLERMEVQDKKTYDYAISKMEDIVCAISKEDAELIVKKMTPRGQVWDFSTIKTLLSQKGIDGDLTQYYLVMNMVYNDFYSTAAAYGLQSDPEFFLSLAKDFIQDPDAAPHKVEKYFKGK